ncbi:MAG: hypothetical protein PHP85_11010 [Gallionella sp.]|nr:hypothetical protein [Gallionella sp.]
MNDENFCHRYFQLLIFHFRWLVFVPVIAFMNGCAATQPQSNNTEDPKKITEAELIINVIPRIGLFNDDVYAKPQSNPAENQHKISKNDYVSSIDPYLKDKFPTEWDMLTTSASKDKKCASKDKECVDSYDMSQFSTRRVKVILNVPSKKFISCTLKLDSSGTETGTITDSPTITTCSHEFPQISNLEHKVQVDVTYSDQSPGTFKGTIPSDFRIIIIGDSYASGEGNPDRENGNGFFNNVMGSALWMDERCHRSAWAAPMQAAFQQMRPFTPNPDKKLNNNKREYTVTHSGAYTIASVACSGARVKNGILENYGGTLSRAQFEARIELNNKTKEKNIKFYLTEAKERADTELLPPQIDLIDELLETAEIAKISMLIVSAGGNDVLFSPLVNIVLRNKIPDTNAKSEFTNIQTYYENTLLQKTLGPRYEKFVNKLDKLQQDIGQVVFVKYPDPTIKYPDSTTQHKDTFCSGSPSNGYLDILIKPFVSVNAEITKLISEKVVGGINKKIVSVSRDHAWYVVDVSDQFRGHGWCVNDSWFRDVDASLFRQHDILGTFHPNRSGHGAIAGNIELAMDKNLDLKFIPSNKEGHLYQANATENEPKYFKHPLIIHTELSGNIKFTPSKNDVSVYVNGKFSYEGDKKNCSNNPGSNLIRCAVECNDDPTPKGDPLPPKCSEKVEYSILPINPKSSESPYYGCGNTSTGCTLTKLNVGEQFNITLKTRHPFTKRLISHTLNNFILDEEAPSVKCSWGNDEKCDDYKWLNKEKVATSSVSASDKGSGSKRLEIKIDGAPTSSMDCQAQPDCWMQLPISSLKKEGTTELNVIATDNVSNVSMTPVFVRLDTVEPSFESIRIYGVELNAESAQFIPSGKNVGIEISGTDMTSGVQDITVTLADCLVSPNPLIDTYFQKRWSKCDVKNNFEVKVTDKAGNSKNINIQVVDVTHFKSSGKEKLRPESVKFWKKRFLTIDEHRLPANVSLLDKVKQFSEHFQQTSLANFTNDDWLLLAGWLNLIDGRLSAAKSVSQTVNPDCSLSNKQVGTTVFAALKFLDSKVSALKALDSKKCKKLLGSAGKSSLLEDILIKEGIIGKWKQHRKSRQLVKTRIAH